VPVSGQEPTLAVVLTRASEYVTAFHRDLAGIVTEEHYVQEVGGGFVSGMRGQSLLMLPDARTVYREFRSDLLLVPTDGGDRYLQFRDVFEVDGERIRDRNDRLLKLFVQPTPSRLSQAARIMAESARYNIGGIERNINVPVFALAFLESRNQPRFEFTGKKLTGTDWRKGSSGANFSSSIEVWAVEYRETAAHTLIRTTQGRDLPARGRFWIESSSGQVLMTELVAADAFVHATITVTYESPSNVSFLVPIEMRETYWQPGFDQRIEAVARYTNFRHFKVTTDESIETPTTSDEAIRSTPAAGR
jgi:hypothetical protein